MTRIYHCACSVKVDAWEEQGAFSCDDAEVWIEDGSILVSYFDEDGIVVLEGASDGAAGWVLHARSRPRRATLAPVDGSERRYVGTVEEGGASPNWTLRLSDPESAG